MNESVVLWLQSDPKSCIVFYRARSGAARIGSSMLYITGRMLGGWRRCCVQANSTCSRRFLPVRPSLWWWSMNKEALCRTEISHLTNFWRCGRIRIRPQSLKWTHTRFQCWDCEWQAERERNFNDRVSCFNAEFVQLCRRCVLICQRVFERRSAVWKAVWHGYSFI